MIIVLSAIAVDHILVLRETGWQLEHSLRSRLAGSDRCVIEEPLRKWFQACGRPEEPPGRYVVRMEGLKHGRRSSIILELE